MQELDLITCFVLPLEEAGIDYMISGSVTTSMLGEPRFTADIDIALFLTRSQQTQLPEIFPETDYYLPPSDVIEIECRREARGHFNIIHHTTGLKADIYPSRNHPYLPWARRNVIRLAIANHTISLAPPEYVILHKLAFYQEGHHDKHIRDIVALCRMRSVDMALLRKASDELKLSSELTKVMDQLNEL